MSVQATMSDPRNNEVRAAEGGPSPGDSQEAAGLGLQAERTGSRDRLRRARVRRAWRRARLFWRAFSSFTLSLSVVVSVIVIIILLIQELTRRTLVIEPISVPKELAEDGYASDVAARRFRDAVSAFVEQAKTSMKGPDIALHGEVPDIVVPTVGISIDSVAEAIRGFLHSSQRRRISGEFTISDRLLWLRLRIDGREFYHSQTAGAPERPDDLVATAVPELLKRIQPYIVASYLYKKDPAQALKIAQQTITRLPERDENVINCYVLEAGIYADRKSYAEASAAAMHAIRIDRRFAPAHNSLGNVLYYEHKFNDAVAEYRRAIEFDSKLAVAHGNIGIILREQHKHDNALAEYRKAIALDPAYGAFHDGVGNLLHDEHKNDEAIAEYRKAIEISPDYVAAHLDLGYVMYEEHKNDEAMAEYGRAIALDPTSANAHNGLGNALYDERKHDEAVAEYRKAAELDRGSR
jgi:Tfp pilus assembly protein PilF